MEKDKKKMENVAPDELGKRLFVIIENGTVEEAKLLAANSACNVNWVNEYGCTPLMKASARGYSDVVKVLLGRQDLLINQQNHYGNSVLLGASSGGKITCLELLLDDPRTDANLVNNTGHSALWVGYNYKHLAIMKLLISHGANVKGVRESVLNHKKRWEFYLPSAEATEIMENWKLYLPEFTRVAKSNKYYPTEFKDWAFNFILCCLRSRSFPKDIIYLLLEYIAKAWKRI